MVVLGGGAVSHGRGAPVSGITSDEAAQRLEKYKKVRNPTLEATQGQILSSSPTDAARFWWGLYRSGLKKPSICPWVASRVVFSPRPLLFSSLPLSSLELSDTQVYEP